jgi:putative DNA primase/helicase
MSTSKQNDPCGGDEHRPGVGDGTFRAGDASGAPAAATVQPTAWDQYRHRVAETKRRACGRWGDILRGMGVPEGILARRNMPCPGCDGTDRFQFTDKFGHGNYHCRHCGAGDGFRLLQLIHGMTFHEALCAVEGRIGALAPSQPGRLADARPDRMRKLALKLWGESAPIHPGDDADRYLRARGLGMDCYPDSLRTHPSLGYYGEPATGAKAQKLGEFPALLGLVQDANGTAVTVHRIYLRDARQLCKKLLSSGIQGCSVQLGQPAHELNVCEGIETALALYRSTRVPTWAAINAGNLPQLQVPLGVRHLNVFGDNDGTSLFSGQLKAYELAARIKRERGGHAHFKVRVHIPAADGTDWADVLSDHDMPLAPASGKAGRAMTH